jgi:hypothetical protein
MWPLMCAQKHFIYRGDSHPVFGTPMWALTILLCVHLSNEFFCVPAVRVCVSIAGFDSWVTKSINQNIFLNEFFFWTDLFLGGSGNRTNSNQRTRTVNQARQPLSYPDGVGWKLPSRQNAAFPVELLFFCFLNLVKTFFVASLRFG